MTQVEVKLVALGATRMTRLFIPHAQPHFEINVRTGFGQVGDDKLRLLDPFADQVHDAAGTAVSSTLLADIPACRRTVP